MIQFIKLNNHKAINEIRLEKLGHINVFCGRNNSGKTAILEAIENPKRHSLGYQISISDRQIITERFKSAASGYSSPDPRNSNAWFEKAREPLIGKIYYEDDIEELNRQLCAEFYKATNHNNTFDFKRIIFEPFIKESATEVKPFLMTPKRELLPKISTSYDKNASYSPRENIVRRFFHLSTQNSKTTEYEIFTRIKEAFKEITAGYDFWLNTTEDGFISCNFSNSKGDWIAAESSGLGLRDILYILHYLLDSPHTVLLIEEPENHVHPDVQRRLLRFMKTVKSKQFFIATHSSVFLDLSYVEKIFHTSIEDGHIVASDETSKGMILKSLGFSVIDNFVSDLIVLTEGPTDAPIIQELCIKLGFFHKYNIRFYPLGGDIMASIDLSVFAEKSKVVAFIDSDPKSGHCRKEFEGKCKSANIPCFRLERYAIENYFKLDALKKVYPNLIPSEIIEIGPNEKVDKQLGFSVKKLGYKVVEEMSLDDFAGTDLLEYVKEIEKILIEDQSEVIGVS